MNTYLIVKCEPLGDQWECDANRTPITITDDWHTWYNKNNPQYMFEVYEFINQQFQIVKEYDSPMESGMVLISFDMDMPENEFNIIEKFPNRTRHDKVPKSVKKYAQNAVEIDNSLSNCGYILYDHEIIYYAYTEYDDNHISPPY